MPELASGSFDPACRRCTRLAAHLSQMRARYPDYHNAPVAPFGDPQARLLIVGLAPGAHGANRTGRPFTGDAAGELLYRALHETGFATRPVSNSADDGLRLLGCRISNAVKCLPPANRPTTQEVDRCNDYLAFELGALAPGTVILALGGIAHRAVLVAFRQRQSAYRFGHDALHELPNGQSLLDSYHCSRYNTQTGRLTAEMFVAVLARARTLAYGD